LSSVLFSTAYNEVADRGFWRPVFHSGRIPPSPPVL
jgi:hypothetical protein